MAGIYFQGQTNSTKLVQKTGFDAERIEKDNRSVRISEWPEMDRRPVNFVSLCRKTAGTVKSVNPLRHARWVNS